jgi:hypothetical protein
MKRDLSHLPRFECQDTQVAKDQRGDDTMDLLEEDVRVKRASSTLMKG